MAVYSLDTSALIDGIERFYPRRNFPALWQHIDELIDSGRLLISEEVWIEAQVVDAPLREWCLETGAGRERAVYLTTAEVGAVVGEITTAFPRWSEPGGKNGADPFVIAVAEVEHGMVISGEVGGGPVNTKIPYVCEQRHVRHGKIVDLIRQEDWIVG